jgi:hypothetical protein
MHVQGKKRRLRTFQPTGEWQYTRAGLTQIWRQQTAVQQLHQPPPPGLQMCMFWRHDDGSDQAVLCQWFPSPFSYGGKR